MTRIRKPYVETPDGQIHRRYVQGPGVPLLLFHRTPVSSAGFEPLMRRLAGPRALYAFDTPGFGGSFVPEGLPDAVAYRDWMIAAIDGLAIDAFHLFAHHTGTHIATEIAAAAPDRARSLMVNGVLFATPDERAAFRAAVADPPPIDAEGRYLAATWSLIRSLFPRFEPDVVHAELVGALGALTGRRQAFAMLFAQDYPAVLARVRCPVLAMAAADDPLRGFLDRVPAALPRVHTQVLGPAGIAAPELDTERLAAAIEVFLAGLGEARA
jgi:pimeloyl-ACP methyl ester carboxylesterase